jgi:prevent-host-death family protein
MQVTSKDLRFHTREILDAAVRGEEVLITYHGKPYAKVVGIENGPSKKAIQNLDRQNDFCGMWKDRDDLEFVEEHVRSLRKKRQF